MTYCRIRAAGMGVTKNFVASRQMAGNTPKWSDHPDMLFGQSEHVLVGTLW